MTVPAAPSQPDQERLVELAASLAGTLVRPGDAEYDAARQTINVAIDCRPFVIVRPANAEDVAKAVLFAREHGLELAIRGGGHSPAGHGTTEGGLQLDMSGLKDLDIDVERGVGVAGAGLTAGEYVAAAFERGFTTPFGDSTSVGIVGLTLGGGIGWLVRKRGLTIDSLLSVELVTADGEVITASATSHPELFWALRGGGGNFGVVTRVEYRLQPIGMVLGGGVFLPLSREVLRKAVDVASAAPEELTTILAVMRVPPLPFIAPEHHFAPAVLALVVYDGDPAEGEAVVAPLRGIATPFADVIGPMPYPGIFELTADGAERAPMVTSIALHERLDDEIIAEIVDGTLAAPSPFAMTQVRILGGAASRVAPEATAYAFRQANVLVGMITAYEDLAETERMRAWARTYGRAVGRGALGTYVNFLDGQDPDEVRAAYPEATLERLAAVKRQYDPTNLFRRNHNIRP